MRKNILLHVTLNIKRYEWNKIYLAIVTPIPSFIWLKDSIQGCIDETTIPRTPVRS
jgi:hypothetical protein